MRTIPLLIALCTVLFSGCSAVPPAGGTAPPFNVGLNLKQLMEWVIDPAVDVIWDSVSTTYTESGTKEVAPRTDEEWANVRNNAAIIAESGNLLMIEGRARDQKEWMSSARRLTTAANGALKAAEAKNVGALFEAGEDIYHACTACHQRYAYFAVQDAAPQGPAK